MNISDNVIDGRDLCDLAQRVEDAEYHRIKNELEELREKASYAMQFAIKRRRAQAADCLMALREAARDIIENLEDEFEDIEAFEELYEEVERATGGYPQNATIVAEDHWEDYVQQLMSDLGYVNSDTDSVLVINWEATANGVANDWSHVTLESGESFYIR